METKSVQSRDVADYFQSVRAEIDAALDTYAQFASDCPRRLASAMRYSLLAPGKRLRPTLAILAADLCGGTRSDAHPACVALESIHAYSLIHDDLPAMDDDDLRRGRPTNHRQFDEATAILAGDALQTFAFETLSTRIHSPEVAVACVRELSRQVGALGMVGGQEDDVMWASTTQRGVGALDLIGEAIVVAVNSNASEEDDQLDQRARSLFAFLRKIHRRKTGALIVAALKLGAFTARASSEQLSALTRYGETIGQAFQITDDLLDAVGNDSTLGKRAHKDAESGKLTYVSLLGVDRTRRILQDCVDASRRALSDRKELFPDASHNAFEIALALPEYLAKRQS